jgi:hypothetical protein
MSRKGSRSEPGGTVAHAPGPVVPPSPPAAQLEPEGGTEPRDEPNLPVHVIRYGVVKASIWRNETPEGPRHNVTLSRVYRGDDGSWGSSTSFGYGTLLALAKACDAAHSWIAEQIAESEVPF